MKADLSRSIIEHGPSVGYYKGKEIPAYYITGDDKRFNYVRVAWDDTDGTTPLDQLEDDESLISPGLIYRLAK